MAGGGGKGGGMKEVARQNINQTQSQYFNQNQGLDNQSRAYVEQLMRPLAQQGIQTIMGGGPMVAGPTDPFTQGLGRMAVPVDFTANANIPQVGDPTAGGAGQWTPSQMDTARIGAMLSPFQSSQIGALRGVYDHQRQQALAAGAKQATAAGAYGGSRGEILQAEALGATNRDEAMQVANSLQAAYGQALNAASQEHSVMQQTGLGGAQLGLQGAGLSMQGQIANQNAALQQAGLGLQAQMGSAQENRLRAGGQMEGGEQLRQIEQAILQEPALRYQLMQQMAAAGLGPYGTQTGGMSNQRVRGTTSTSEYQPGFNPFGMALGGLSALSGLGGISGIKGLFSGGGG